LATLAERRRTLSLDEMPSHTHSAQGYRRWPLSGTG
jgi:hypothetical protein